MALKIIDISVPVTTDMFRFPRPDHVRVKVSQEGNYEEVDCRTSRIVMGSHSGTHIDAPLHMIEGGTPIDRISLQNLIGPARVLRVDVEPNEEIDRGDVAPGMIDQERIILDTGWYEHWGQDDYYDDFPRVTTGFAKLLVEKGVRALVVDLPLTLNVHNVILGAGGCQIENVIGLDRITEDEVTLIALPLRIEGIDAAPARVVVMEE